MEIIPSECERFGREGRKIKSLKSGIRGRRNAARIQ